MLTKFPFWIHFSSFSHSKKGFVDECYLDFALDTFQKHFEFQEQGSIAESIITLAKQTSINMEEGESTEQWNKFLEAFYKVAYSGYHIKGITLNSSIIGKIFHH